MDHEPNLRDWGRQILGRVLRQIRVHAGLKTNFAQRINMRASMIRMIEAGHVDVPVAKIPRYATELSVKAEGPRVDPEALALAYATLRAQVSGQSGPRENERFDWSALKSSGDPTEVEKKIYEELTRPVPYDPSRKASRSV